jgi:hypothetical protein
VRLVSLAVVATVLSLAAAASAQGSYRAVPTGGRSALMGDTGIALARDGSAPFLNPATIASIADPRVALSVSLISFNATTIEHYHAPRGNDAGLGREELSDGRLEPFPTTFCFFVTVGEAEEDPDAARRKLALCAGTSERRDLTGAASANGVGPDGTRTLHIASIARSYARVHVGPTYALPITKDINVGASLHIIDTRVTSLTSATATASAAEAGSATTVASSSSSLTSSINGTSFDIAALLGATIELGQATTLGIAFEPPSVHVGGDIDANDRAVDTGVAAGGSVIGRTRAATGRFFAPMPMRLGAGIGFRGRRTKLEADLTYFFPMADLYRSEVDVHTVTTSGPQSIDRADAVIASTDAAGVLDSAVGAEVFVNDSWSVLGGLATDFGGVRSLPTGPAIGSAVTMHEDRAIATFGVGNYTRGGGELLVGAQFGVARGEILVADDFTSPSLLAPTQHTTTTVLFVVAGSTNLSSIKKTFDHLRQPLR